LSIEEERKSLVYALLKQIQQIRGLLYYRLLKVLVVVGHQDIECCYLMPSEKERATGILADDYYLSLIQQHSHKMDRRREKVLRYMHFAFETIQKSCEKLIKSGVMDRLFKNFYFFSEPKNKITRQPRQRMDEFGDLEFKFSDSSSDPDETPWITDINGVTRFTSDLPESSQSETDFQVKANQEQYEVFVQGFFYFFVL